MMPDDDARWRWLGDPLPDEAGFVARALIAEKHPAFVYCTAICTLVREALPGGSEAAGPGLTLRLRFDADAIMQGAWKLIPVWLVRRARLRRKVEAIAVEVADPGDVVLGAERLLAEAATVIDTAVSKRGRSGPLTGASSRPAHKL